ncbi:MAG TPA: S9 family peptidase [Pyrinomonadaceae bacterium]|jgi:dipeptidyl aminopeptidase/acylaminoacyl peptidase|nr:S9 family peptidase [Pyrinomonadaceae bacterium]
MKSLLTASLLIVVFAGAAFAQTTVEWTPELQIKLKAAGTPRVSPDGKRVVYTVSDAVMTSDKSEFVTQIWMAMIDGKTRPNGDVPRSVQLTFGDKSSTNPKWSPDGNWIAFTSTRKDNKSNIYILNMNGGEAEPLTEVKTGVTNFAWSPDGRSIAFRMADAKTDEEEKNDKAKNDFRWVDENVKMSRLYVIPVQKDMNGKREPRKLTAENYNVDEFDWSADGSRIVFGHTKTPSANDWTTSDVSIVEVATGKVTPLANTAAAESSPIYSPDGKSIAVSVSDVPVRWAQSGIIQIFSASGGAPKNLTASYDAQPGVVGWSADSKRLYFAEPKGTGTQLYVVDVAANRIEEIKVTQAVYSGMSLNTTATTFGFVRQTSDTPGDVFVASTADFTPVQISRVNADVKLPAVGRTEVITWKSKDGKQIEGLLTYPVGYQAGQRVPLLLNVHGGPAGVFQQSFLGGRGAYPLATFAARGYAILRANPRGSSGYGTQFRQANIKDWGMGDYQDLMTGVDRVIEMGVADPNRLGVMGWSYGGFMTSWIVTQTKRFKAASAGAPVTNLMSFNGTADIPAFVPDYFGAQSWDAIEVYQKHSPMFNVKGVSTPTMVQHGEADVRVPISQGYEFYNALKSQGVPTRMIVLPRQPHGPNEPKMQLAAMQANLDWFQKYIDAKAETSRN